MTVNGAKATDFLIMGGGIAGLSLAIRLAAHGRVTIIVKGQLHQSNSRYAQGGIASVLAEEDSFDQHVDDTIIAGAGLCHRDVVEQVVREGPSAIHDLIRLGVHFTKDPSKADAAFPYHLTKEGGHSARRVIHADDTTGVEVMRALIQHVRSLPNIELLEHQYAVDLITTDKIAPSFAQNHCLGAYVFDTQKQSIYLIRSAATFLCTGGHGRVYLYTSNPDNATGDGLAIGWRAGCKVANLEFMQFHPTCLYHPQAKNFLISEAVRGEGAILRSHGGDSFMERYHPLASLAPRDIVARAIDAELKRTGQAHVYLDATVIGADKITRHFPNIYQRCLEYDLDITKEWIPVVPAAHYSCGGLIVDQHGRTRLRGLYAIGEVACTGLHGANRLASNSLLEALVFARRAADHVASEPLGARPEVSLPPWNKGKAAAPDEMSIVQHAWEEVRRLMWHYVGIMRSDRRLQLASDRIQNIRREVERYYWEYELTESIIEVRNLCHVAELTINCAMARKESRGIHFNIDYPESDDRFARKDTLIW